jgi:DNA polymerase-3 subunit delta'
MARAPAQSEAEDLPEADRLEGFPHPRETSALVGQDAAEQALAQAFASGRMHHAWLIAGRAGVGKATLAYRLARHALARPGERDPAGQRLDVADTTAAARQVRAMSHPGLLVLRRSYDPRSRRFAASIPVDEVRRLRSFLGLTADEGAWRVVIVDPADELNASAANALLKSLEEPPLRAIFLLIASEPNRLLPTIRSRCRRLDLHPLAPDLLRQATEMALAAAGMDSPAPQQWQLLERLAEGSVRRALQLTGARGLELYEQIGGLLAALPSLDWAAVHALGDQLASAAQEQRFQAFFDLLLDLVARLVRARANPAASATESALAQRLIQEDRLAAWATAWEDIVRERADAALLNLDRKAVILGAFARLEGLARR